MQGSRQWYYRGSLKSCNYSCSYCPFSKKKTSIKELQKDKEQFFRFIERLEQRGEEKGAVQIVPYGEALIHEYYWEGLARLSQICGIEAVGAQSNFSFPVEKMMNCYRQNGGQLEKLRLWGTFHSEMTSVETFVTQCEQLSNHKIAYCVGVVGNPLALPKIQQLREKLDFSIYLWINKMDGLGRNYTKEEIQQFLAIDEYFALELKQHKTNKEECGNQIFVQADGKMKRCNLCKESEKNFYQTFPELKDIPCTRTACSCYLAYNNRKEMDLLFFQPYPAFRIPTYPKAVFFDIDGTLIPKGQHRISEENIRKIKALAKHSTLYLATSLPLEEALRKVKEIRPYLNGGVFACGARWVMRKGEGEAIYDQIAELDTTWLERAKQKKEKYGFRIHIYQKENAVYKVTLSFPLKRLQKVDNMEQFIRQLIKEFGIPDSCQCFNEENCIEIIRADRGKLAGILDVMNMAGYQKEEIMVVGDAKQDEEMLEYFPFSVHMKERMVER